MQRDSLHEALVLSTCNRVEFLVSGEQLQPPQDEHFFYNYSDRKAVRHLFRVASSLDSMVVGEPEILGQVKDAYQHAKDAGTIRGPLELLLTHTFRVARRVRNETAVGKMAVSVSYVAVELARKIFGDLDGLSVLLIGAGEVAESAAQHLHAAGASQLYVANRTYEKACELAQRLEATAVEFDRLLEMLQSVNILISSTSSRDYILTKQTAEGVIASRRNRPIFLVDIAVPRDIDPQINEVDNMLVYDIDDLQQVAAANQKQRSREAVPRKRHIDERKHETPEKVCCARGLRTDDVAPTIVSIASTRGWRRSVKVSSSVMVQNWMVCHQTSRKQLILDPRYHQQAGTSLDQTCQTECCRSKGGYED
ncbi:Glutamyl-tRNA reductase [Geodia barretti]|uniref:glutamyl-tRNA reductase n=1 Tax=Geodia barretti TaxID=519541 RepID=A0AA35SQ24_GEOBA|nr:Glutamyl-tRNA reductase [Geodia barretti]